MPLLPGVPPVDEPLVLAAPEAQLQVALRQHKGPVDEQVHLGQQGVDGGVVFLQQLLVGTAGVSGHVLARAVDQPGQLRQGLRLAEGLPPAEGDAL